MPRYAIAPLLTALASALVLGCGNQAPTQPIETPLADLAATLAADSTTAAAAPAPALEAASKLPEFDPGNFVRVVDNKYFPLPRGARFVYEGTEGSEPLKNVSDVTDIAKTILGVKVVVVLDRLFRSGALVEKTFDYFAQDKDGNVWYLGEDTKEFENGKVFSTAGTFEAGKDGAKAGIIMRAHPKVGQTTQQEFAPGVAEDMATVLSLDATVSVPYGTFDHCLKTEDFTPLEPGAKEVKFYCPAIGFTRGRDVTGGSVRLHLTRLAS